MVTHGLQIPFFAAVHLQYNSRGQNIASRRKKVFTAIIFGYFDQKSECKGQPLDTTAKIAVLENFRLTFTLICSILNYVSSYDGV